MNIQMVNMIVYVLIIKVILYCFFIKDKDNHKWKVFVKDHLFLFIFLLAANTLSFAASLKGKKPELYIERQSIAGSEKEYSFEADIMGDSVPFKLEVPPKKLKPKEVEALMEEAFSYMDEHIMGENNSLDKVDKALDFSMDTEKYPFDVEVIPEDYGLIDEDGNLRNLKKQLESEGYTSKEMLSGILTEVKIIFSYGDVKKEKTYAVKIFPKEESDSEKLLSEIEQLYKRKEQESIYEDGFLIPTSYKGIDIISIDRGGISPEGILVIGIVIAVLLLLREAENKRSNEIKRNKELLQAYPWCVYEMVLLFG